MGFGPAEDHALSIRQKIDGVVTGLSEEERRIIGEKTEALKLLYGSSERPIKATFKIEVMFGKGRSINAPFPGHLTVWKSGSALDGGGDEIVFPCPSTIKPCSGYIMPENNRGGKALCMSCHNVWRQRDLKDAVLFKLVTQRWADVLVRAFVRLNYDADLYIKTSLGDIRDATLLEQTKNWGGEKLARARTGLIPVIYPMQNLFTDLKHGADLYGRIYAFLKA